MEDEESGGGMSKCLTWNNKYKRDRFRALGVRTEENIGQFCGGLVGIAGEGIPLRSLEDSWM